MNPMRVTLFWYIIVSPFVEFPVVARVTPGEAERVGPAPKVEGLLSRRGSKEVSAAFFAAVCKLVLGGTETPKGRGTRSRRPSAAGRRKSPEAVTKHKTGYITADTRQSKVLIGTLAAKARRNRS